MYAQISCSATQSLVFQRYNKSGLDFRSHEYSRVLRQITRLDLAQEHSLQIKSSAEKFSEMRNRFSFFTEIEARFSISLKTD